MYPLETDFVLPVSNGPANSFSVFQATDPLVNGYPSVISTLQAGSTTTMIVLNASSSTIPNFYVGNYLQIGTQFSMIISYNSTTQTATVNTAYTLAPGAGTTYYIRGAIPILSSNLVDASTQNIVNLGPAASTINDAYVGYYIYFTGGVNGPSTANGNGVAMLIVAYNGSTQAATLAKALPNFPGTDPYDILQYSSDSFYPLVYNGTIGFNQPVCYSIELLYITIPNQIILSGYGGTLNNYPYLYLHLFNEGNMHSDHVLYSNNPAARSALFKIPLGLNLKSETFFTLKDAKMIQVTKIKLDQPMHFRLVLPDGSPIIFQTPDNTGLLPPNPLLQISATFALRRIDSSTNEKK